jgi:hypothetical protein
VNVNPGLKWTYIRCSVDLNSGIYFILKNNDSIPTTLPTFTPIPYYSSTTNSPEINYNSAMSISGTFLNKGVIFLRQLRLWECYNCLTANSWKMIISGCNFDNFPALLHSWDPIWDNNQILEAVNPNNTSYVILNIVNAGWLGNNVIDETNYGILDTSVLCGPSNCTDIQASDPSCSNGSYSFPNRFDCTCQQNRTDVWVGQYGATGSSYCRRK